MIDIIIINEEMKCIGLTCWRGLETVGGVRIPECLRPQKEKEDDKPIKMSTEEYKNGGLKDDSIFLHTDRVKNLIVRENKTVGENERAVAVKMGSVSMGKIITNDDIIIL